MKALSRILPVNMILEDYSSKLFALSSRATAVKDACVEKASRFGFTALNLLSGAVPSTVVTFALSEFMSSTSAGKFASIALSTVVGGVSSRHIIKDQLSKTVPVPVTSLEKGESYLLMPRNEIQTPISTARKIAITNACLLGAGVSLLCSVADATVKHLIPAKPLTQCGSIAVDVKPRPLGEFCNRLGCVR